MTAAYGVFFNHGPETINVTAFASDSFTDVSLHKTTVKDGVSRMEHVSGLTLPAGGGSVLEPGGMHLMLMKPAHELHAGDMVSLTLSATNGRTYQFSAPVENR